MIEFAKEGKVPKLGTLFGNQDHIRKFKMLTCLVSAERKPEYPAIAIRSFRIG